MWEDMLKYEEPWWTASLKRMLEEAREYHKEASDAFYRLKKKLYEQKRSNDLKIEATADIYDLLIGEIKQNIVYNKKTIAPEIQAELNKIVDEFSKGLAKRIRRRQ